MGQPVTQGIQQGIQAGQASGMARNQQLIQAAQLEMQRRDLSRRAAAGDVQASEALREFIAEEQDVPRAAVPQTEQGALRFRQGGLQRRGQNLTYEMGERRLEERAFSLGKRLARDYAKLSQQAKEHEENLDARWAEINVKRFDAQLRKVGTSSELVEKQRLAAREILNMTSEADFANPDWVVKFKAKYAEIMDKEPPEDITYSQVEELQRAVFTFEEGMLSELEGLKIETKNIGGQSQQSVPETTPSPEQGSGSEEKAPDTQTDVDDIMGI